MAVIGPVPQSTNPDSVLGGGWAEFFNAVQFIIDALTRSGTTANRPLKQLWIGRTYFDTTLGIPIWYNGTAWVNATGGIV